MNKNITLMTSISSILVVPFVLSYIFISYIKSLENKKCKCSDDIIKYLSVFVNILGVYIIYSYSDILSNSECDCSKSWKRVFLKYYSYIMISLIGLSFLSLVAVFIYHITTGNEKPILNFKKAFTSC